MLSSCGAGFYTCTPIFFSVTHYKEEIIAGPPPPECTDQLLVPEKTTRNEVSHFYLPLKNTAIHEALSSFLCVGFFLCSIYFF